MGKKRRIKKQKAKKELSELESIQDAYAVIITFLNNTTRDIISLKCNETLPESVADSIYDDVVVLKEQYVNYKSETDDIINKYKGQTDDFDKLETILELKRTVSKYLDKLVSSYPLLKPEIGKVLKVNDNDYFINSEVEESVKMFLDNIKALFSLFDNPEAIA